MISSNQSSRTVALWAVLLALCLAGTGVAGAAEAASKDPIAVVPAESIFFVKINNLNGTLNKIDQFLTGISPIGVSMLVPAQLTKLLGGAEAKGIDMSGDFAVFGPLPGGAAPTQVGVLVPVSDYKQFVQGNPNVSPPDVEGISGIGAQGTPTLIATDVGNYALVTAAGNQQALIQVKKLLAGAGTTPLVKRLSPEMVKQADEAPVWAYVNVQAASKIVAPMLQAKLQEAKEGLKEAGQQGPPMMAQADEILDMYAKVLDTLMAQTQSISLSLDPSAAAIRSAITVSAMPGTEMAKVLATTGESQQRRSLVGFLQNNAIINTVAIMDPAFSKALTTAYIDLFTAAMGQTMPKEEMDKIRTLTADAMDALGGSLAWSLLPAPTSKLPFALQYAATLRSKEKFYNVLTQAAGMMKEGAVADFYKQFGMKVQFELQRNVESYKDVSIDAIRFNIEPTDANTPQAQMMKAIYGGGFDIRLAVADNLLLYALSDQSSQLIKSLIDQAKSQAQAQAPSEFKAAMNLIPGADKADFAGTYNYVRLLQIAMKMMPMAAGMPSMDVPTQSNIAFAGGARDGKLLIEFAVPKQHVLEVMGIFMRLQQQKMQQQQGEQPQGAPQQQM